jgi:hypothetical protein
MIDNEITDAARASTLRVLLSATHWNHRLENPQAASQDAYFWYLYDQKSAWLQLLQFARDEADQIIATPAPESREAICSCLGQMIQMHGNDSDGVAQTQLLGTLVLWYWQDTQTHLVTPKEARHRFIVRYHSEEEGALLRPFASPFGGDVNCPIPAEQVLDMLHAVVETDRANHPEWFRGTERNRNPN